MLTSRLNAADEFAKESGIDKELCAKIKSAIRYNSETQGFSWKNQQDIFNELPIKLRYEIAMNMYKQTVNKINFFSNQDPFFITAIVPLLNPAQYMQYQYIYIQGDVPEEIYFIAKGKVSMVEIHTQLMFCYYPEGEYFGDFEITNSTNRLYSTMCIFTTSLLVLNKSGIATMKNDFPSIWNSFANTAKHKETLCAIALETAHKVIDMRKNKDFSVKTHEEVKDIYNRMILDSFFNNLETKTNKTKITINNIGIQEIRNNSIDIKDNNIEEENDNNKILKEFQELNKEIKDITANGLFIIKQLEAIENDLL